MKSCLDQKIKMILVGRVFIPAEVLCIFVYFMLMRPLVCKIINAKQFYYEIRK